MIDRGFIKWQPFNSLTPSKDTIIKIENKHKCSMPSLFPEETTLISENILKYYYSKEHINITYYEDGKIKNIVTIIKKINPNSNTIELGFKKILSFYQIIHITSEE